MDYDVKLNKEYRDLQKIAEIRNKQNRWIPLLFALYQPVKPFYSAPDIIEPQKHEYLFDIGNNAPNKCQIIEPGLLL